MKLVNKLLPLVSVGTIAMVITPLTTSCGPKGDWKDVTKPDTTDWKQSQYSGQGETKPEVTETQAQTEYFGGTNQDIAKRVTRDVQWSGYESKDIINRALAQYEPVKNHKISKFQEYFKDFSWDGNNKVASYKLGLNASISVGLEIAVTDKITFSATVEGSFLLEIETHNMPMVATSYWIPDSRNKGEWNPGQHQMISIDYLTLLDGWEAGKYADAYEKLNMSINGKIKQKYSDEININFQSGPLFVNKDTEPEFVQLMYMIAAEFTIDGWFSYFFDRVTLPEQETII